MLTKKFSHFFTWENKNLFFGVFYDIFQIIDLDPWHVPLSTCGTNNNW